MPQFPKREPDVLALAEQMVNGVTSHAADFPSVDGPALAELVSNYKSQVGQQELAKSQAQVATANKDEVFADMVELMKNDLKLAEVDTADDPQKLYEIGWGPRSGPTPIQAPGTPTDLHPTAEGQGSIWLNWEKSPVDPNRPVRIYIIERRDQQQDGTFGPWKLAQTTYNTEIQLTEQPVAIRVEYRVKAANAAGESMPSNSVSVVLP